MVVAPNTQQTQGNMTMTNTIKSELKERVSSIFKAISEGIVDYQYANPSTGNIAHDFLDQAINIEYIVSGRLNYSGARILVSYGGPSISIDTSLKTIDGYWDGESVCQHYYHDEMDLGGACKEMYEIAVSNRYSKR